MAFEHFFIYSIRVHNWKIFETAKAAKKAGSSRGSSLAGSRFSLRSAGSIMMQLAPPSEMDSHNTSRNDSGGESGAVSHRSSMYFSEDESVQSDGGYSADLDSLYGYVFTLFHSIFIFFTCCKCFLE